jgi:hypothetical protein
MDGSSSCYVLFFFFSNDVGTTYEVMVALHSMTAAIEKTEIHVCIALHIRSLGCFLRGVLQSTGYGMADSIW